MWNGDESRSGRVPADDDDASIEFHRAFLPLVYTTWSDDPQVNFHLARLLQAPEEPSLHNLPWVYLFGLGRIGRYIRCRRIYCSVLCSICSRRLVVAATSLALVYRIESRGPVAGTKRVGPPQQKRRQ